MEKTPLDREDMLRETGGFFNGFDVFYTVLFQAMPHILTICEKIDAFWSFSR